MDSTPREGQLAGSCDCSNSNKTLGSPARNFFISTGTIGSSRTLLCGRVFIYLVRKSRPASWLTESNNTVKCCVYVRARTRA